MRGWCVALAAPALLAGSAAADLVTLDRWDASLNFGVLADGGGAPMPLQGPEAMSLGAHVRTWQRVDGVAQASAWAQYEWSIDESPAGLGVSLILNTSAWAQVGQNPTYPASRAIAEVFVDEAVFEVVVNEAVLLRVSGASLGGYAPGVHTLAPGQHTLGLLGPLARASVDVGGEQSASDASSLAFSFEIVAVPGPATSGVLAGIAWLARRRRAI